MYINSAEYPTAVHGWLVSNSEIKLAKRTAPLLIERLEKMNSSGSDIFGSIQSDIERLKRFAENRDYT